MARAPVVDEAASPERSTPPRLATNAVVTAAVPFDGLLSKLGHELRSPLGAIVGLARIMLVTLSSGQADPARQITQLGMIQASAGRSLRTVEQVVEVVRIESGRVELRREEVDCRDVVLAVVAGLRSTAESRGVRLGTDLAERPVAVATDPELLAEVLHEVIGNGLRFTDGGTVSVGVHQHATQVVIDVSDEGPGIPADEQRRIFQPFERGARAVELDDEGAGLGLYLAVKRADLLGASLRVSSAGSTFTLILPSPTVAALPHGQTP